MQSESSVDAAGGTKEARRSGWCPTAPLGFELSLLNTAEFPFYQAGGDTWFINHRGYSHGACIIHLSEHRWFASVNYPTERQYFKTLCDAEVWVQSALRARAQECKCAIPSARPKKAKKKPRKAGRDR